MNHIGWEFVKLALQFVGAVIVARLAVTWALTRHKSEKVWERQSDALANVIHAIQEMLRVNDRWMVEEAGEGYSEEYSDALRKRYTAAKQEFERVSAIGAVVLPTDVNNIVVNLDKQLNGPRYESWFDEIDNESAFLKKALADLVNEGRKLLGTTG